MVESANLSIAINATVLTSPMTGVGRYVSELTRELCQLGVDFQYFDGMRWRDSLPLPPPESGLSIHRSLADVPGIRILSRCLRQVIFSRGVRVSAPVLYHEPAYVPYRFDGPVVITAHDASWVRFPETHPVGRVRYLNRFFPKALERAERIIVDSEFVGEEMNNIFGISRARMKVIPLGVSPQFRPVPPSESSAVCHRYGLHPGRYVLTVGTLEPRKNLSAVVQAMSLLPESIAASCPLVFVGMQGWRHGEESRQLSRLERAGRLRLLGHLPESELACLYSAARLFVYVSLYEGFGLPPLEAMASGVPVIVSDGSSLPEVVGDVGLQVNPHDVDSLAGHMRRLFEDESLCGQMIRAGLARAGMFTWKKCAQQTLSVYREVLA